MATYSSNTTIKASTGVNAIATALGVGNTNVYTGPATGYAIVQMSVSAVSTPGTVTVRVDGRVIYTATTPTVMVNPITGIYIGPSQVINVANTAGTVTVEFSGISFINSP